MARPERRKHPRPAPWQEELEKVINILSLPIPPKPLPPDIVKEDLCDPS